MITMLEFHSVPYGSHVTDRGESKITMLGFHSILHLRST